MIDLNILISDEELLHINNSKNKRTKLRRIKDITCLYNKTLFNYIDKNCNTSELIKCGFCNSIRRFTIFDYVIIDNKLFIDNIKYDKDIFICSRNDNLKTKSCKSKELNPNSLEMVKIAYGFKLDEEANAYLLNRNKSPFYKTNYSSDKEYKNYQKRDAKFYGSEEKFNEIRKKIGESNKKESLIKKFSEEKTNQICKLKDSSSKEFFIKKYGEDWEFYLNEKGKKCSGSLERFIKTHGEIIGEIKYNEFVNKATNNSKKYFDSLSSDDRKKIFGTAGKEYFKNKYGAEWESYYNKHQKNIQSKSQKASNESLKFFDKLIDKIKHFGLKYYIGVNDNKEWFIYDSFNKKLNFYDFCIKELNLIIEFHGSVWHFNPNFEYKKPLFFNRTLDELKEQDEYKQQLAIKNGFKYYVVFDTDNYEDEANYLFKIIEGLMNERTI